MAEHKTHNKVSASEMTPLASVASARPEPAQKEVASSRVATDLLVEGLESGPAHADGNIGEALEWPALIRPVIPQLDPFSTPT